MLAAGLAACSSSGSSSGSNTNTGAATTGKTLVMESSPESTITQAFNPFVPTQAAYGMGATGLIYEPLIQFNMVSPPKTPLWLRCSPRVRIQTTVLLGWMPTVQLRFLSK